MTELNINNATLTTQKALVTNPASEQSSTTAKITKIATVIFAAISARAAALFSCLERFAIATGIVAVCDKFDRMLHYLLDCDFEKYVPRSVLVEAFRIVELGHPEQCLYTKDPAATLKQLEQNKYEILGVNKDATRLEIEQAALKLEAILKPLFLEADKANCPLKLKLFAERVATALNYATQATSSLV